MVRHGVSVVGAATFLSVLIFGTASYRGGQYMDSTQFCGQTCHTVMTPRAYSLSKFAPLAHHCVECHIGPGASRFVRSKLSGVRQVFAFTPIRAPSMRRSNTCAPRKLASNVTQSPRLAGEVAAGLHRFCSEISRQLVVCAFPSLGQTGRFPRPPPAHRPHRADCRGQQLCSAPFSKVDHRRRHRCSLVRSFAGHLLHLAVGLPHGDFRPARLSHGHGLARRQSAPPTIIATRGPPVCKR